MGLYKGRYLIALYDQNDNFIDCATQIKELKFVKPRSFSSQISRGDIEKYTKYKVYFIDCIEKHQDVFSEEDELFLKEEKNNIDFWQKGLWYNKLAEKYGVNKRTIQRYIKKGKINLDNEMAQLTGRERLC